MFRERITCGKKEKRINTEGTENTEVTEKRDKRVVG